MKTSAPPPAGGPGENGRMDDAPAPGAGDREPTDAPSTAAESGPAASQAPLGSAGGRGVVLGARVVVRHLIEDGARATDVIGIVVALDEEEIVIDSPRHGVVTIARGQVVAAKAVPPAPERRR